MCCRSLAGMFRNPHGGSRVSNCQRIVAISLQCLHKTTRVSVREAEAKHDAWVRRRKKKAKKKKDTQMRQETVMLNLVCFMALFKN